MVEIAENGITVRATQPLEFYRDNQQHICDGTDEEYLVALDRDDLEMLLDEGHNAGLIATTFVTDMSHLFNRNIRKLPTGFLSSWDTSNVKSMSQMFVGQTEFNQDISNWDTHQVTTMRSMFSGASSFNQPLAEWNTGAVTNMSGMFSKAISFDQPLNSWDVSRVHRFSRMFDGASSFNQPLDRWNTGSAIKMDFMFSEAASFNQPVDMWDFSRVINCSYMFVYALEYRQPFDMEKLPKDTYSCRMFHRSPMDPNVPS